MEEEQILQMQVELLAEMAVLDGEIAALNSSRQSTTNTNQKTNCSNRSTKLTEERKKRDAKAQCLEALRELRADAHQELQIATPALALTVDAKDSRFKMPLPLTAAQLRDRRARRRGRRVASVEPQAKIREEELFSSRDDDFLSFEDVCRAERAEKTKRSNESDDLISFEDVSRAEKAKTGKTMSKMSDDSFDPLKSLSQWLQYQDDK